MCVYQTFCSWRSKFAVVLWIVEYTITSITLGLPPLLLKNIAQKIILTLYCSTFWHFSRLEQRRVEMNEKRTECDLADKLALADQRRRDMEVGSIGINVILIIRMPFNLWLISWDYLNLGGSNKKADRGVWTWEDCEGGNDCVIGWCLNGFNIFTQNSSISKVSFGLIYVTLIPPSSSLFSS